MPTILQYFAESIDHRIWQFGSLFDGNRLPLLSHNIFHDLFACNLLFLIFKYFQMHQ